VVRVSGYRTRGLGSNLGATNFLCGLENREYGRGIRFADHVVPISPNVGTNFADKLRSPGRYSSLADSGHGVCSLFLIVVQLGHGIPNFMDSGGFVATLFTEFL
jgi:hypothetical protein